MTDVVVPVDLWEDDKPAVITSWLARDGAEVRAGDLIAEIMVEKVQFEISASAAGRLTVLRGADDVVAKGDTIARIG
jgi:pyruvate/2-oxoglutarate dehydrogenase complex dihydrolipoamide acyltransferase (E2) component